MAKRVELVYGRSGSGKTTWCMQLAEAIYEKHGLKTRWLIGDGGFETVEAAGLVDAGIVEPFHYTIRNNPLQTTQFICEGYWPEDPLDPKSRMVAPNYDELGKKYGFFVFEGLTVMAEYVMGDKEGGLSQQAGEKAKAIRDLELKNQLITEDRKRAMSIGGGIDSPYVVTDLTGDLVFGGVSMSGFGFMQRRMKDFIERTRVLPGMVYWTAHQREIEAKDNDDADEPIVGPDVAGKKLTSVIGASFGNTIHMHLASKKLKEKDKVTGLEVEHLVVEHRAYTRPHYDPDRKTFVKFYANNRMPVTQRDLMPEFLTPADPLKFYALLEEGRRKHEAARKERLEKLEVAI
jgi:hypothetical protein